MKSFNLVGPRDLSVQLISAPDAIKQPFNAGGQGAVEHIAGWISADSVNYALILERFGTNNSRRVALDIGANRGFYVYYLAALGFDEVHAWEIEQQIIS